MEADENTRNLCSEPVMGTHVLWVLVACHIFLAITSTVGNTLILIALYKESSLHPPSKTLLRSLALTDFFAGLLLEPLFVIFLTTKKIETLHFCYLISALAIFAGQVLCLVSLLTLTAISVDRLLALLLGMRYRQVVTFRNVLVITICVWTLSIGFATAAFWNKMLTLYYICTVVLLCILVSTCAYIKIFQKRLHHEAQIQEHVHQGQPNGDAALNIARYRKTVSSALWVQFSLLSCYLPFGIVTTSMAFSGMTPSLLVAWTLSATVMFSNSTLNPILYCWKIREVRRATIETIRQILCCLSSEKWDFHTFGRNNARFEDMKYLGTSIII